MNCIKAGFSRVNINPSMRIPIKGYFKPGFTDGVLDELELNALALKSGDITVLHISIDNCGIGQGICEDFKKAINSVTNVPCDNIIISATHTHTGPAIEINSDNELIAEYTS